VGKTCAKRGLSSDAMELKRFWIVIALDQSKSPFSNLFPRGVKSDIVGFSKIDVSLDFFGHLFDQAKRCEKRYEIMFYCLTAAESFLIQLIHTFVLTQKCAKSQDFRKFFRKLQIRLLARNANR
jgi:hypothetical protein